MARTRRVAIDGGFQDSGQAWTQSASFEFFSDIYVVFSLNFAIPLGGNGAVATSVTLWQSGILSLGPPTAAQIDFFATGASPFRDPANGNAGFPGEFFSLSYDGQLTDVYEYGIGLVDFTRGPDPAAPFSFDDVEPAAFFELNSNQIILTPSGFTFLTFANGYDVGYQIGSGSFHQVDLPDQDIAYGDWMTFAGTAGNDAQSGSVFDDILLGSLGNDVMDGGAGNDVASFAASATAVTANLVNGTASGQGSDTLVGIENLVGSAFNDVLTGSIVINRIDGGAGHDFISSGGNFDIISGGNGNDILRGGNGGDTMDGGSGIDTLDYADSTGGVTVDLAQGTASGSFANNDHFTSIESLAGSAFADTLTGNSGDNRLDGGAGADVLRGGNGNDVYVVDNVGDQVIEGASTGTDRIISSINTGMGGGIEELELVGAALNGNGNALANVMIGNDLGNRFNAASANDRVEGRGGDDVLIGGTGADTMLGGTGNDVYYVDNVGDSASETGGNGIDEVRSTVSFTLVAGIENLRLQSTAASGTGNAAANSVFGNSAANILSGLGGNDLLYGEGGNDSLGGGTGDDILFGAEGNDTLDGGDGADRLRGEDGSDVLNGGSGVDLMFGSTGIDTLNGGNDNDVLRGEEQNDILNGGQGVDQLFGGDGNDTMDGGTENDRLTGGAGRDAMTGGTGADRFLFDDGDFGGVTVPTADRIADFSHAQADLIDLSAVDAIVGGADNGFAFIGTAAFGGVAGQLRYAISGAETMVYGDTNGDSVADFAIRLTGALSLLSADFVL